MFGSDVLTEGTTWALEISDPRRGCWPAGWQRKLLRALDALGWHGTINWEGGPWVNLSGSAYPLECPKDKTYYFSYLMIKPRREDLPAELLQQALRDTLGWCVTIWSTGEVLGDRLPFPDAVSPDPAKCTVWRAGDSLHDALEGVGSETKRVLGWAAVALVVFILGGVLSESKK